MGENSSKWNNWQMIDFQNIQADHTTQCQKNTYFIAYAKALTVWITTNCWRFLKRWEYQTTLPSSWETCLWVKKQHLEPYMEQLTAYQMQIKTTMRYHLTRFRMAAIKKSTNNKCWRGCGEKGIFLHCWWECKLVQPLWRTVWRFLQKLAIELP